MENNPEEKLFQIKAEMPAEVVLTNYLVKITFKIFEIHRVNILAMFEYNTDEIIRLLGGIPKGISDKSIVLLIRNTKINFLL